MTEQPWTRQPSRRSVTRLWLVALAVLAVIGAATLLAALRLEDRHEATAVVGVRPQETVSGNWQLVSFLLPNLQAQVRSSPMRELVLADLAADGTDAAAAAPYTVVTTVEPGTGVLRITASSTARELVVPVANRYAERLVAEYADDPALQLTLIDPAQDPSTPTAALRRTILLSGFALAVLAAVLVTALAHRVLNPPAPRSSTRSTGSPSARSASA